MVTRSARSKLTGSGRCQRYMPKRVWAAVQAVRLYHLVHTQISGHVRRVPLPGDVKVPGPPEVILRARPAMWARLAVQVKLDLALAPPTRAVYPYGHIGADVTAADRRLPSRMVCTWPVGHRVGPPPMGVEIAQVVGTLHRV